MSWAEIRHSLTRQREGSGPPQKMEVSVGEVIAQIEGQLEAARVVRESVVGTNDGSPGALYQMLTLGSLVATLEALLALAQQVDQRMAEVLS